MTDGLGESIMGEVASLLGQGSARTEVTDQAELDYANRPNDSGVEGIMFDNPDVTPELGIPEGESPGVADTPIMAPVRKKVKKADTIKVKETPAQAQRKSVAQSRKKANTAGVSGVSSTGGSGISIVGA